MAALFFLTAMMAVAQLPDSGQKKITLADLKEENFHFEVVSIHRNRSGDPGSSWSLTPDDFRMNNLSLDSIVRMANGILLEDMLVNLPKWAEDERYDIQAKVDEDTAQLWKQLSHEDKKKYVERVQKNLLVDRFGFKSHAETRVLPAYDLVITKNGLKMKEDKAKNGWFNTSYGEANKIEMHAMDMESLVNNLSSNIDRKIIDKTGLGDKKFTFTLTWTPDAKLNDSDAGPSIYAALEEQLGLKLVATKAPVEVVVVDHIERPSEN